MHDWSDDQITVFARQFRDKHRATWGVFVGSVREALIDSFVLGQRDDVTRVEIRSLRTRLGVCLARQHGMPNQVDTDAYHEAMAYVESLVRHRPGSLESDVRAGMRETYGTVAALDDALTTGVVERRGFQLFPYGAP